MVERGDMLRGRRLVPSRRWVTGIFMPGSVSELVNVWTWTRRLLPGASSVGPLIAYVLLVGCAGNGRRGGCSWQCVAGCGEGSPASAMGCTPHERDSCVGSGGERVKFYHTHVELRLKRYEINRSV